MLDSDTLDLGYLALFAGNAVNQQVLVVLGGKGLKPSQGYVVQFLLSGPKTIGELAKLLGVTQQAVSKTVAEMGPLLADAPSEDGRVRRVELSAVGHETVEAARAARRKLDAKLRKRIGGRRVDIARAVLLEVLEMFGGLEAVRRRRVRPPR
jgi:DNA-binding MarR family transcriptional regulator